MPLCLGRALTKASICAFHSRLGSTISLMLGRSKPNTNVSTWLSKSCSAMSARVTASAVAVRATMGTRGRIVRSVESPWYSGRKAGPHCEMQWASSTAIKLTSSLAKALSIRSVMRRSGARYSSLVWPVVTRRQTSTFCSRSWPELMASAPTPARRSACTWSCMSAIRGDTTIVRPLISKAGTWKHNDLPEPVGITVSTWRPASRASTTRS